MSEYHAARHVFGEMTFGEYWNLAGCQAECCSIKTGIGSKRTIDFGVEDEFIMFRFQGKETQHCIAVPLSAKVKINQNKVIVRDANNETVIRFYRLEPLESPV